MNREVKNQLTKGKVLESAMVEFADKGYDAASMNSLCASGGVSKGIVYHYFQDKDELYMACVSACFNKLLQETSKIQFDDSAGIEEGMKTYFDGREAFFAGNPECCKLFCSATSNPPEHLSGQVAQARSELDALSLQILIRLVGKAKLRPGIQLEEVAEEFQHYQDYFNLRTRNLSPDARERACRLSLNILLYGVIENESK